MRFKLTVLVVSKSTGEEGSKYGIALGLLVDSCRDRLGIYSSDTPAILGRVLPSKPATESVLRYRLLGERKSVSETRLEWEEVMEVRFD
jgi:hypothetical protein